MTVAVASLAVWRPWASGGVEDESTPATSAVPPRVTPTAGAAVEVSSVPLLVDERLRVTYDDSGGLIAQPLDADASEDAFWQYSRDATLLGVDIAPDPDGTGPVVVAYWSDRVLVGVDGLTGERRWARDLAGDESPDRVELGAATPEATGSGWLGLSGDDGDVVVVPAGEDTVATDSATGRDLWSRGDLSCRHEDDEHSLDYAVVGSRLVVNRRCRGPVRLLVVDMASGDVLDSRGVTTGFLSDGDGCRSGTNDACATAHLSSETSAGTSVDADYSVLEDGEIVQNPGGIDLVVAGDRITATDRDDESTRWTAPSGTGQGQSAITDAVIEGDEVWVTARAWQGGPGGIIRLDLEDGSVTGCATDPDGYDGIFHYDNGWLTVSRNGQITLLVPDLTPTCSAPGTS